MTKTRNYDYTIPATSSRLQKGDVMREIVGAMINGGTITNNRDVIIKAHEAGRVKQWLCRKHMQFMSSCDLGRNWDLMANGPTLFLMDENNKPHSAIDNKED